MRKLIVVLVFVFAGMVANAQSITDKGGYIKFVTSTDTVSLIKDHIKNVYESKGVVFISDRMDYNRSKDVSLIPSDYNYASADSLIDYISDLTTGWYDVEYVNISGSLNLDSIKYKYNGTYLHGVDYTWDGDSITLEEPFRF